LQAFPPFFKMLLSPRGTMRFVQMKKLAEASPVKI
jgi:hypothetical protein